MLKPFFIVIFIAVGLNFLISGRLKAFYEKPELTIYPVKCVLSNCFISSMKCFANTNCRKTLECIDKCTINEKTGRIPACAYICEMTHGYENLEFLETINCLVDNKCLNEYPKDGICYGEDSEAVQTIKNLNQVKGDWWVIRGLNCGYGDFPGGYDWYPCQHERFIQQENGQWINNVTYCSGKHDECTTEIIVTIANISLPSPGVIKHDYIDAPLAPQTESWRIISWPNEGDFLFMLWCGQLPILDYNGGIVLSRHRNDEKMPQQTLNEFKNVADRYGLKWKDLCPSNNIHCPI